MKKDEFKIKENITRSKNEVRKKLYLGEIIEKEKPIWKSNNLILAPVGSGKTFLIENNLINEFEGNMIFLVSNTTLKDYIAPKNNKDRKYKTSIGKMERTYNTQNEAVYGEGDYKLHVMTYAEFGKRIFLDLDESFTKNVKKIFCDDIHSLSEYYSYGQNYSLGIAMQYLFSKHENHQIFYFTATDENLINLQKKYPNILKYVTIFDYRKYKEIRKYIPLSEYKINHINQIRPHLRARRKSFTEMGYKGLAFTRLISTQEEIAQIAKEEGFIPLAL